MTGAPLAANGEPGPVAGAVGAAAGAGAVADGGAGATGPSAAASAAPGAAGPRQLTAAALPLLAALLAAILASAALSRFLPLPPGDPLAGTLTLLPVLLAAFYGIHRLGVRQGGRRLSRAGTAGELAALGLLLAAALARPALALDHASELLAAGMLLVLAHRLARQMPALRPLLGSRLGPRPSALFFWLPLCVYIAILPWSAAHRQPDGDEPYNLLLTHSLAFDGDTDLANNYAAGDWRHFMDRPIAPQPGDPSGPRGEVYSRHNALLPLVLVPAYRLFGKTGAQATMALLTAALAWLTLRLGRHYTAGRPGESLVAYALVAFAPPLLFYSYQIWVEVPAALLAMAALDGILALAPADPRSSRWRAWLAIGLPVLLLPLLKIRFILIAAPLAALAAWRTGRQPGHRRPALALAAVLLTLVVAILLYNQHLYSNPLKIHSLQEIDPYRHTLLDYLGGSLGLFYDCAFGLFGFAPIWLLLLPALALLLARRAPLPAHLAFLSLPYLLAVTPRGEWYGGWSPPFRYALIALPLLGLALAPLLAGRRRPGARALIGGLGAATLALAILWVVVPGWTYNLADGRTYVLDHLASRLGADLARFFPSVARPRAATWIWTPLSLALVIGAWWLPGRRRRQARRPGGIAEAALAGIAVALAAAAVLPIAAARAPTRVIELEDQQVIKLGGHLYPDRWVIERTRYRGGWVLRVGDQVRAPVVAGGRRVRLTLAAELIRNQPVPFAVDIAAGERLLAVWTPVRERAWEELSLGPFDWPPGAPLVLTGRGPHPPGALNGAVLDRIELTWE
ncbi:MAG TPA: hypothetical protein VHG32_00075 [Thermoanaerobaculia bacterium]|nr:hypothetical protein [Thermoanaerobaculia bacterium]